MPLNRFLVFLTYTLQTYLVNTTSAMILNTTLKYPNNSTEELRNISDSKREYSAELFYCDNNSDCNAKIANSWCYIQFHECYCLKGYALTPEGACLLKCADDSACAEEDVNRVCLCENYEVLNSCRDKLCKCKANYFEEPSKADCVSDNDVTAPIDNNGLIIVCVVTGVSPLTIVLIAVCCKKCLKRSEMNTNLVNNSTQRRATDGMDGEPPPTYEEIVEPPPSYAEVIQGFGRKFQRSVSHFVRQISNIENS